MLQGGVNWAEAMITQKLAWNSLTIENIYPHPDSAAANRKFLALGYESTMKSGPGS
jgi:hypothetical protein